MAWFLTEPLLLSAHSNHIRMKTSLLLGNQFNKYIYALFTILGICLFSCKKDEVVTDKKVKGEAKIKIINAVPSAAVDFYLDNSKVNDQVIGYGVEPEYIKIHSGEVNASFSKGGITGAIAELNFVPTLSYTSFYVEDKKAIGSIVTLEDNFGATASGMARVRIVNLSPYFTNTVNVNTSNELLLAALDFKDFSANFTFNPDVDLRFSIIGTGTVKTMKASEFEAGKTYTVWIGGTSNSTLSFNKISYN